MPLNWTTTANAARNGVKVLCYAPAGYGKTVLGATAPRPIILSSEFGNLSIRKHNIPVLEIRNGLDMRDAYDWIMKSNEFKQHFDTLVWDGASESAETFLRVAKASGGDGRAHYGTVADMIADYFTKFRALPEKHVYITAKMGFVQDSVTGAVKYGPDFPGKQLGQQSPYWLDEVFTLRIGTLPDGTGTYRYLQTQPDPQYDAKDRSGSLDAVEQPNLTHIFNKIMAAA